MLGNKAVYIIFAALYNFKSLACSAPPPKDVEETFKEAQEVYLVAAKSIKIIPKHSDKASWTDQEVVFEVLHSWKGNYKIGDRITYTTNVSTGCGVSVDNYNHWLEDPKAKTAEYRFPKFSGIWLIYSYGANDRSLNATGRTRPLEFGGAQDLETLYKLGPMKNAKAQANNNHDE